MRKNGDTGLVCPRCHRAIKGRDINNLLVDNRGAWHKDCYEPEPTENEGAKGISLVA
jgi:hypothetical protein